MIKYFIIFISVVGVFGSLGTVAYKAGYNECQLEHTIAMKKQLAADDKAIEKHQRKQKKSKDEEAKTIGGIKNATDPNSCLDVPYPDAVVDELQQAYKRQR
ncbi:MAG: hypothetical protein OEX07_13375 [Gammaproteobacteria bacterium]|nr:hypothetical protein [Gammaproteobacteria bacterium]